MPGKEEILKEVHAALEREPLVNLHRYPVAMSFDESEGVLTLEGEVDNVAAKKIALELAAATPGVLGITDRLRVTPSERMADGAIRDHVRDALLQEPALQNCAVKIWVKGGLETFRESLSEPPCMVDVSVADGVVTLNGRVASLGHKRLAGVLAWWVPGSCDVVNGLEVLPPEEDSDDEITDVVRLVFEKDPYVTEASIRVSTRNAVVTLDGLVTNQAMKDAAEFDAWYVFGVDKVINKLEVLQ